MGVEYYLVNHANKTFFELGKGSWYELNNTKLVLYEPCLFVELLKKVWYKVEDDMVEYYNDLGLELFKFVRGTAPNRITVINDCADDTFHMRRLKYKCVGSRCWLGEEKNKECVEFENRHVKESHLYSWPNKRELERLESSGWNIT